MAYIFGIQQFYQIVPDERVIDQELAEVLFTDEKWRVEESERLHRMYQVIMENKALLDAVLTYVTLAEHDLKTGGRNHIQEYYHAEVSLVDILLKHRMRFHVADRKWLVELSERVKHPREYEEPLIEIEPLENVFRDGVKPLGFTVKERP